MNNKKSAISWLWLTLVMLVIDQATKHWVAGTFSYGESINVLPFFNLTYVHNLGAAFSFLADQAGWQRWFFATIAFIASIIFTVWLIKTPSSDKKLAMALALMLSGAVGNLIDRVLLGYVIDFLDFYIQDYHWPAFNVADSAIFIGAAILIFDSFKKEAAEKALLKQNK